MQIGTISDASKFGEDFAVELAEQPDCLTLGEFLELLLEDIAGQRDFFDAIKKDDLRRNL